MMHSCTPAELFGVETASAIFKVRTSVGFNPLHSGDFWESWMAMQLGGIQTKQKHPWDVSVEIGGFVRRIEVKYSRAYWAKFTRIRGADYSRKVFKWMLSKQQHEEKPADIIILIGVDTDSSIYSYVLPRGVLTKGRSITVTAPSDRRGSPGRFDEWLVPPTEILPAVKAAGIKARRRAGLASGDLFQCEGVES